MKGQSAIEYLTTYGWMLIAVGIAASVVYTQIGGGCGQASLGFQSSALSTEAFGVDSGNNLVISMRNEAYENITMKNFTVEIENQQKSKDLNFNITPGKTSNITLSGYRNSNDCNNVFVELQYDKGPLKNQRLTQTIVASIDNT